MPARHPIIALWAVPRSVSTAFERMVAARGDFAVFNEPYSAVYYFGPDRVNTRYPAEAPSDAHDPASILESFRAAAADRPVFFKDMAYHVRNLLSGEFLAPFTNTALIRDPRRSIPSLYKKLPDFTLEETGFEQLARLVDVVTETTGTPPPVIDGRALRRNPADVCRAWCDAVGISFKPESLSWNAGNEDHWERWTEWFDDAANSCGFEPPDAGFDEETLRLPRVADAVARCMPYYEKLSKLLVHG